MIPTMTEARARLHVELRERTSCRNRKQTNCLVAFHLSDDLTRNSLLACTRRTPCRLPVCQGCERRATVRYLNRMLPIIDDLDDPDELRFVTVNLFESLTLAEGDAMMPKAYRQFRSIIAGLRKRAPGLRIWGNREVEPKMDADTGVVTYHWHLHFLVHLSGLHENDFADALRQEWPEPRAVRIDELRQTTGRQLEASVIRTTIYSRKVRFTFRRPDGKREWLPSDVLTGFANWMLSRPRNWARFTLTPTQSRARVPYTGMQSATKTTPKPRRYTLRNDGGNVVEVRSTRREWKRWRMLSPSQKRREPRPGEHWVSVVSQAQFEKRHMPDRAPDGDQGM